MRKRFESTLAWFWFQASFLSIYKLSILKGVRNYACILAGVIAYLFGKEAYQNTIVMVTLFRMTCITHTYHNGYILWWLLFFLSIRSPQTHARQLRLKLLDEITMAFPPNKSHLIFGQNEIENLTCEATDDLRNWTHQQIAREILYSTQAILRVKVIIPLIFVIGFLGNVAFFLLLARVKKMRTITNFYLVHLAAADLMMLTLDMMFKSWRYIDSIVLWSHPFHTSFGCAMFIFGYYISSSASTLLITLVSFDRYFAICRPITYLKIKKNKRAVGFVVLFLWIVSAVLAVLNTLRFGKLVQVCLIWPSSDKYIMFPNVVGRCDPIRPSFGDISRVTNAITFAVAFVINVAINIKIFQKLRQKPPGENGNQRNHHTKRRITWMLMANTAIFFCFLAPSKFLVLQRVTFFKIKIVNLSRDRQENLLRNVFLLAMVNSAVNPILYGVASPSYRRGFLKAFGLLKNQIEPTKDQETGISATK